MTKMYIPQCFQFFFLFFFDHKKLKKPPSKVAHNRPKPFLRQSSPGHSPQPRSSFPFYKKSNAILSLLLSASAPSNSTTEVTLTNHCFIFRWDFFYLVPNCTSKILSLVQDTLVLEFVKERVAKGQLISKSRMASRRFFQKTNWRIWFVCRE